MLTASIKRCSTLFWFTLRPWLNFFFEMEQRNGFMVMSDCYEIHLVQVEMSLPARIFQIKGHVSLFQIETHLVNFWFQFLDPSDERRNLHFGLLFALIFWVLDCCLPWFFHILFKKIQNQFHLLFPFFLAGSTPETTRIDGFACEQVNDWVSEWSLIMMMMIDLIRPCSPRRCFPCAIDARVLTWFLQWSPWCPWKLEYNHLIITHHHHSRRRRGRRWLWLLGSIRLGSLILSIF